jgi:hypothetical protein
MAATKIINGTMQYCAECSTLAQLDAYNIFFYIVFSIIILIGMYFLFKKFYKPLFKGDDLK